MPIYAVFGVPAMLWLLSVAAALLALRWSLGSKTRRFRPALGASLFTLAMGYVGLTRFHASASQTVNGVVQWRLDSNWFFILSLVLGAVALALTLWHWRKSCHER